MSELKKAVTSDAAIQEKVADDATINGTNAPSIEDAKTMSEREAAPAEVKAETAEPVEEVADPATEEVVEEKAMDAIEEAEIPAELDANSAKGGQIEELNLDHLFADEISLGSTLQQNPNGGMNINNLIKPKMDYTAKPESDRNQVYTAEELQQELESKKD